MRARGPLILIVVNAIWLLALTSLVTVVMLLMLHQQSFDHRQTQTGQAELKVVVRQVETHLDATIRSSIAHAAKSTVRELGQ